jgi:methanogenic corrinoid protein MtbC1
MSDIMENRRKLLQALVSVDRTAVFTLLSAAFAEGGASAVGEDLRQALEEIGTAWEKGSMSLAQVYMSGVIGEEAVKRVLPADSATDLTLPQIGTVVFLDHHGLGMKIVSTLVRSAGYPVKDLGLGADVDRTIEFVGQEKIRILLVSVLMLPSALALRELCQQMANQHPDVKIVAGGAPFRLDEGLWERVGAHGTGKSAGDIFDILLRLRKETA